MLTFFSSRPDHPLSDARELKRALTELPSDNPFKAVDEISGWLESLHSANDFRVDQYFDVVRQLDDVAQPQLRRLARDYLHAPRLSKTDERRLWTCSFTYYGELAGRYARCLERAGQNPKDKGSAALKPLLPLASARLLAARAAQLRWLGYRYGPITGELWEQLGQAYLAADTAGYARKSLQLYPSQRGLSSSSTQQYLHALVFQSSSIDCLMPIEIELADRLIAHFLPAFDFTAEPTPSSVHWVDAAQGMPPTRLARQPDAMRPTLRFFSPGSAPQALNEMIHQVERGKLPDNLDLGGQYAPKTVLPVLRHLALYWAAQPPLREHRRHSVKTRIAVLHGFDNCFTAFAGEDTRDAESWVVENVSLGGFGADIGEAAGDWIKVGALLCVQPEGGENWVLGTLRRYNKISDVCANVGIQSLSRQAQSIELRPRASGFSAGSGIPGIWLRSENTGRQGGMESEVRLLLPPASFDLRESLEFSHEDRNYLLTPVELEESASDYEIARYRERGAD